jgi:hypothetical protein
VEGSKLLEKKSRVAGPIGNNSESENQMKVQNLHSVLTTLCRDLEDNDKLVPLVEGVFQSLLESKERIVLELHGGRIVVLMDVGTPPEHKRYGRKYASVETTHTFTIETMDEQ